MGGDRMRHGAKEVPRGAKNGAEHLESNGQGKSRISCDVHDRFITVKVTSEDWPLVEHVLDEVEALPEGERAPALERICQGRPELRVTVERILEAQLACDDDSFLEEPAAALAAPLLVSDPARKAPSSVGPFRILREVGRGGYGTVYLGERTGVGQRVAVKVLRAGAGRAAQRRFRREQRLLASLEHPCIPRLIDSGVASTGESYLAMEFVEGEPITTYVTRNKTGLRDRLRLFVQACEAVRHAHAHLVVHRDIKPQNVLVGQGDRFPIVKVVDFGIAKPLSSSDERITRTGPAAPMTLAYAAPEQLRGEPADPATDVHALGLLLYTLLADRLPYDLAGKSRRDAEAMVLDAHIARPSSLATGPWARRVRGDLDHVVLKALAKDRARRYPTADALCADVERFLEGLPVAARRPSRLYAAWRIAWRRRALLVGAAVAVAAAGTTYAAGLARERAAALRAAEERAVVAEVLADVLGAMEGAPESSPSADAILERATQAIRARLGTRPALEAELLVIVADQLDDLGRWADAVPLFERAVAIESTVRPGRPQHASALLGLGACLVSEQPFPTRTNLSRAERLYREAGDIFATVLGSDSPSSAEVLHLRARIRYVNGDYQAAHTYSAMAVQILSEALRDSAKWEARYAGIGFSPLPQFQSTQGSGAPNWIRVSLWTAQLGLGNAELALGMPEAAAASFRTAAYGLRRIRPFEHNTAAAFTNLGDALYTIDHHAEAERSYRASARIFHTLYGPDNLSVARALDGISAVRRLAGDLPGALRAAEGALQAAESSGDSLAIVMGLYNLGFIQRRMHHTTEAIETFERTLVTITSLGPIHNDLSIFAVNAHAEHASALASIGRLDEAEEESRLAYQSASTISRAGGIGLPGTAYAEILALRGHDSMAIDVLRPLFSQLWNPPIRSNPRLLAARMARQLSRSHANLGNYTEAQRYRSLAARFARVPRSTVPNSYQ